MNLWTSKTEIKFFEKELRSSTPPKKLFYRLGNKYFAYVPKNSDAKNQALNSRNSLIGQFTEKWCKDLFNPVANSLGLYAVNGVICDKLGLTGQTSADLAFCTTNEKTQVPKNIKLLFEIKMSIISNYEYTNNEIKYVGDFKTHKGNPSLLRSDSMLKAIGKSINIKISDVAATKIPIVILGNSPITDSYIKKVDILKQTGVIQNFWSLNPKPTDDDFVKYSPNHGFETIFDEEQLTKNCEYLIRNDFNYFSSMSPKVKLGSIVKIASLEDSDIGRAEKFLTLIQN